MLGSAQQSEVGQMKDAWTLSSKEEKGEDERNVEETVLFSNYLCSASKGCVQKLRIWK